MINIGPYLFPCLFISLFVCLFPINLSLVLMQVSFQFCRLLWCWIFFHFIYVCACDKVDKGCAGSCITRSLCLLSFGFQDTYTFCQSLYTWDMRIYYLQELIHLSFSLFLSLLGILCIYKVKSKLSMQCQTDSLEEYETK